MHYHTSFTAEKDLYIVMPLMAAGTLKSLIKNRFPNGLKDEVLIASILLQVVEGLSYLHSKQLMHRDIRADNILVDEKGNLKIAKFTYV